MVSIFFIVMSTVFMILLADRITNGKQDSYFSPASIRTAAIVAVLFSPLFLSFYAHQM